MTPDRNLDRIIRAPTWHSWRAGMMDRGRIEIDSDHRALVHDIAPRGVFR